MTAPPAPHHLQVTRLAELFDEGRCSLFLGAGVSVNAGLPSWAQLLDMIAAELDYPAEDREALAVDKGPQQDGQRAEGDRA